MHIVKEEVGGKSSGDFGVTLYLGGSITAAGKSGYFSPFEQFGLTNLLKIYGASIAAALEFGEKGPPKGMIGAQFKADFLATKGLQLTVAMSLESPLNWAFILKCDEVSLGNLLASLNAPKALVEAVDKTVPIKISDVDVEYALSDLPSFTVGKDVYDFERGCAFLSLSLFRCAAITNKILN